MEVEVVDNDDIELDNRMYSRQDSDLDCKRDVRTEDMDSDSKPKVESQD
jgi:hypothetical protein